MKEIKSLTGIRGIAALWVVCMHYFESIHLNKDLYISNLFSNGFIAVDLFFLLSAFVMCLAYSEEFQNKIRIHSYIVYIKKRFARIYPAYIFWVLMFLSFDFIKFNFDYNKILFNFLLIQNLFNDSVISIVFWSLCSEWILYLIFPFLYFTLQKANNNIVKVSLIVISVVGIYLLPTMDSYLIDIQEGLIVKHPTNISVVWGVNSIIRCLFSYVIGINLYLLIKNVNNIANSLINILKYAAILGVLIISFFGKTIETYVLILICLIILISVLYISRTKKDLIFASPIIYFFGQISYSIYLCHMFILVSMSIVIDKFFLIQFDDTMQMYLVVGSLILLVPISYLSYRFVEVKGGNWLKFKLLN